MPQGTIKTYDPENHSGVIFDDAKNEFLYDLDSYRTSGMREFRLGQRVRFSLIGEPGRQKVRDLIIVSF